MKRDYKQIPIDALRIFYLQRYREIEERNYKYKEDKNVDSSDLLLLVYMGTIHQDSLVQSHIGNLCYKIRRRTIRETNL